MGERIKSFTKFLKSGGIFRCDLFTQLIGQNPEQIVKSLDSLDEDVSIGKRQICNCYAQYEVECDCPRMPLLHHFVYVISHFGGHFDTAKEIINLLIERGCDPNETDPDIGTVLHSVICGIYNDKKANAPVEESQLSFQCLEYLLEINVCDLNADIGKLKFTQAYGTPLGLAIDMKLTIVVEMLIASGANVKRVTINEIILPPMMTQNDIHLYDLLYFAGYDRFPNYLTPFYNIPIEYRFSENSGPIVKYTDWIKRHKSLPMSLKYLSRIVFRELIFPKINNKIVNAKIPPNLIPFLRFKVN